MGLADRHYMRDEWNRPRVSATVVIIIGIIAAFVLQEVGRAHFPPPTKAGLSEFEYYLALSTEGLKHAYLWQLITFQFLHGGVMHLIFNVLGVWFLGRFVEYRLGARNFLKIYLGTGVAGGLLQAALGFVIPDRFGAPVVGASAGVCGVLAAAAMLAPHEKFLLWFVLPVRTVHVLIISIVLALLYTIFPSTGRIAHAAHLGGLLAGVAFIRWKLYGTFEMKWHPFQNRQRKRELVKAASLKRGYGRPPRVEMEDVPSEEFISREVDPILDKISAHGIQSLTERERKILEAARKKMVKR